MRHAARLALALTLLLTLAAMPASAMPLPQSCTTVVVVLAPYLTWEDIESGNAPALASLALEGAVASANIQAGSLDTAPSAARGAAILSAGQPVDAPDEDSTQPMSPVGGLGEAVRASGGFTAAIGTSAAGIAGAVPLTDLPALLVAGDASGAASLVTDANSMLAPDAGAPYGMTANLGAIESAYREALDSEAPRRLIVIDPGEFDRARSSATTSAEWDALRTAAVQVTDDAVAQALSALPDDAVLIVISTGQYEPQGTPGLGPVIAYGAGSGVLFSAGTRSAGLVTLPDLTATIAALLGVDPPAGTTGQALTVASHGHDSVDAVRVLARENEIARALESVRLPAWIVLGAGGLGAIVAGCIAAVVLAARRTAGASTNAADSSGRRGPTAAAPLAARAILGVVLVVLALPLALLLVRAVSAPLSTASVWLRIALWGVFAGAGALALAHRRGVPAALGIIGCANALLVLGDQVLGAPLAAGSPLSYSVIFGTRFYGLGNEGAGVLAGAALLALGWYCDRRSGRPWMILAAGVPTVLVAVLPFLGANVGVAAWGTAGFVAAYLYAARRRVTWRVVAGTVLGIIVLAGAAAVFDLASSSASHLGQLLESARGGGVVSMLARKLTLAAETFLATPAMIAVPAAIALAARLLARPGAGPFGEAVRTHRGSGAALCGAVTAALVALVTEDSGAVVAALVMFMPTAGLIALALDCEIARCSAQRAGCAGRRGAGSPHPGGSADAAPTEAS